MNRSQPANSSSAADPAPGWKTALLVVAVGLYLTAFYTAQPVRWQSLLVILLPDQVVSSWVGNDWGQFQVLDRLPIVAVAGLILILAYLGGRLSMAAVGCDRDLARLEVFVFSTAVGLAQWSLVTLAIGLAGGLRGPWLHLAAVGVMAGWAIWQWKRTRGDSEEKHGQESRAEATIRARADQPTAGDSLPWLERHGLWFGLPFLLLILLGAMLPPWDFDVREYHLQVPKEWYQAGRIGFLPHNVYGNMPLGAEMHALLGMVLMPGERSWWWGALAGKTVIAGFAPLTALGLLAAGRRFVTPGAGVIAALVYLSVPWVVHVSQAGLIEGAVACYLFLAVYGIAIWAGENGGRRAGDQRPDSAISVSIPTGRDDRAAPSIGLACADSAGRFPGRRGGGLQVPCAAVRRCTIDALDDVRAGPVPLATGGVVPAGGPLQLRTVVCEELGPGRQSGLSVGVRRRQPDAGANRAVESCASRAAGRVRPPLFRSAGHCGSGRLRLAEPVAKPPAGPVCGGGFPGHAAPAFGLGCWPPMPASTWPSGGSTTHRVDRFWVPILPVVALLAGVGAVWPDSQVWRRAVPPLLFCGLAANLLFLSSAGVYDHRYLVSLEQLRRDEPAKPDGPSRVQPAHRYLNGIATAGDRVLLVGDAQPFDLEMPVLYDTCFDECRFERWMKGRSAAERRAVLNQEQITYVLVNWSEIERYRSPGNYGFTAFVTKSLVRDELVRDSADPPAARIEHGPRAGGIV